MTLSCVAICKNEEHNVADFIKNLHQFNIHNLYITDTGSTDRTVQIFHESWNPDKLFISSVDIVPFDFSKARNENIRKVLSSDQHILHLDLDERIERLPVLEINCVYPCTRKEILWGTTSSNITRITPAIDWHWSDPIHESLRWGGNFQYMTDADFVISHHQRKNKNFYSDLTALHFKQDTRRLFYHYMCDCMREEKYAELISTFEKMFSEMEHILKQQQAWQIIRNYQIALVMSHRKPNLDYLYVFYDHPSHSSHYYLSFFYYYLGDVANASIHKKIAEESSFTQYNNETFYNQNIKNYVTSLRIE
jgi:glycosyltransferase involved in cell wall biosynthesis